VAGQNNYGKTYYINVWKEMLGAFLDWTEEDVTKWINETWLVYLNNPEDILYHQTPQYWLTMVIIPDPLRQRLAGIELARLHQQLFDVFKDEQHFNASLGTDWRLYRSKIEQILAGYGEQLPKGMPGKKS
jgi:hypothetical protein